LKGEQGETTGRQRANRTTISRQHSPIDKDLGVQQSCCDFFVLLQALDQRMVLHKLNWWK
jgi:hypothetical protein